MKNMSDKGKDLLPVFFFILPKPLVLQGHQGIV